MKIAVYGVAKDEELNVAGWYESTKDADYHFILDTGSTDKTIDVAKSLGINVLSASFSPWNEALAKNVALSLLPTDIDFCILLDIDQKMLTKNWKSILLESNCLEYDGIEHYLRDSTDEYNEEYNKSRGLSIHKRKNCYWDKYRPRLRFYINNPKILKSNLQILGGYGADEKRFKNREGLYLDSFQLEYQRIIEETELDKQCYLLEIIAHQAFNFFESDNFINFLNKQKEFMNIYNKINKDQYSHLYSLYSIFCLANAILDPKNAYKILFDVLDKSQYKKNALLKQNIIMFWLKKEELVEELSGLSNDELISIYADTKTGKFKFELAKKSYKYFMSIKDSL